MQHALYYIFISDNEDNKESIIILLFTILFIKYELFKFLFVLKRLN